ncbi:AtpZ/AtpI family protein [Olivibacter sitiensis]|uniref:AtpZ/AtpI family protein n=1 Tax=Olivibacter sitiensis TaxID=376470 RepID=UPI00041672A7|nr:AtpZ/AtpI family protein [Olivibacter sitiensis]
MDKDDIKNNAKNYAYYTGVGFQMIAVIGILTFIGYKIDTSRSGEVGVFTIVFSLLGVVLSLVSTIRSIIKKDNQKK